MALIEQRILKQVTVIADQNTVNVQWADQILRDDQVISETFHRKSYSKKQKEEFLSEVDGASNYVQILGW